MNSKIFEHDPLLARIDLACEDINEQINSNDNNKSSNLYLSLIKTINKHLFYPKITCAILKLINQKHQYYKPFKIARINSIHFQDIKKMFSVPFDFIFYPLEIKSEFQLHNNILNNDPFLEVSFVIKKNHIDFTFDEMTVLYFYLESNVIENTALLYYIFDNEIDHIKILDKNNNSFIKLSNKSLINIGFERFNINNKAVYNFHYLLERYNINYELFNFYKINISNIDRSKFQFSDEIEIKFYFKSNIIHYINLEKVNIHLNTIPIVNIHRYNSYLIKNPLNSLCFAINDYIPTHTKIYNINHLYHLKKGHVQEIDYLAEAKESKLNYDKVYYDKFHEQDQKTGVLNEKIILMNYLQSISTDDHLFFQGLLYYLNPFLCNHDVISVFTEDNREYDFDIQLLKNFSSVKTNKLNKFVDYQYVMNVFKTRIFSPETNLKNYLEQIFRLILQNEHYSFNFIETIKVRKSARYVKYQFYKCEIDLYIIEIICSFAALNNVSYYLFAKIIGLYLLSYKPINSEITLHLIHPNSSTIIIEKLD